VPDPDPPTHHRGGSSQYLDPPSPWVTLSRADWARLRSSTPLTISAEDLERLQGVTEQISEQEVTEIYLPLSRLLNLYVSAIQQLHQATETFLGSRTAKVPFVIGVAGSVSVGKSTTSRLLQALLSRWPDHPEVALVTTDGFLLPNAELERRGLMQRKGFPESYDTAALVRFVADVKAGGPKVTAPVYSHLAYDVLPDEQIVVEQPDVLIIEGINVLQTGTSPDERRVFVSDFFDFSIYVDAEEADIEQWYVDRFHRLRATAFQDPRSYFRRYGDLDDEQAEAVARDIWTRINGVNLRQNVLPTRSRADLILHKAADHSVEQVHLRKL
jgi:type I pantothenate kinase